MTNKKSGRIKFDLDARTLYDINKNVSNTRVIMTSIVDSMVLTMFVDYLNTFEDPEGTAVQVLDGWKHILLAEKKNEIINLQEGNESLTDMAVINSIVNDESYQNYESDLDQVFDDVTGLILAQLHSMGEE